MFFECVKNSITTKVPFSQGKTVLSALSESLLMPASPCGGRGSCGKCKVKLNYFTEPTEAEKRLLTPEEIGSLVRLACQTKADEKMCVFVPDSGRVFSAEIVSVWKNSNDKKAVVDLGTTTVTAALVDAKTGEVIQSLTQNNSQAAFGADVISRINATDSDGGRQHRLITEQVCEMLSLLGGAEECVIAGNTTMLHLFFGACCKSLGEYPYTAAFLNSQSAVFGGCRFVSPPCIHSFVGADTVCGVYSAYRDTEKYSLLIDLGTNAEIALFNRDRLFVTSAAAGPAFEGAKISCGSAAVAGAIKTFHIVNGVNSFDTVGGAPASGICGSGLIDIVAALIDSGRLDETGALDAERFEITEKIYLTAGDIRELQLAKAAVAAATELIVKAAGIDFSDIHEVLLSGGFGSYLNIASAKKIGLIPASLFGEVKALGNSCIKGASLVASDTVPEAAKRLIESAEVLNLGASPDFTERFIENLLFSCAVN